MTSKYCLGVECPVRNGCKRYNDGREILDSLANLSFVFMRKCTSQKKYIQDENVIKP